MSKKDEDFFTRFTTQASSIIGRPLSFVASLLFVALWATSGPLLGFSDTWQLIINTSTTVITFLIVFVIQNTQNRDSMALNLKIDVMLEEMGITRKRLIEAEDESDKKLEKQKKNEQKRARSK